MLFVYHLMQVYLLMVMTFFHFLELIILNKWLLLKNWLVLRYNWCIHVATIVSSLIHKRLRVFILLTKHAFTLFIWRIINFKFWLSVIISWSFWLWTMLNRWSFTRLIQFESIFHILVLHDRIALFLLKFFP